VTTAPIPKRPLGRFFPSSNRMFARGAEAKDLAAKQLAKLAARKAAKKAAKTAASAAVKPAPAPTSLPETPEQLRTRVRAALLRRSA
jgi:hypothetical protein